MGYIGTSPVAGAARVLEGSGTGDGTTVAFAIGFSPAAEQEVLVFIDGTKQDTDAYSISGSTCTFTAAPMTGENIDFIGFEVGKATVPQDNSVDSSKINDGSISLSQLKTFTSAEQTITATGSLTIAHSLGALPSLIQARLICKTTEHNYSVDDELMIPFGADSTSSTDNYGVSVAADSTNISIRYGSASQVFRILNKTTGANSNITIANWKLIVRAWS